VALPASELAKLISILANDGRQRQFAWHERPDYLFGIGNE
jgi:hypothetical protein